MTDDYYSEMLEVIKKVGLLQLLNVLPHTIHVWYIYLHLVDFYGKCREIYHTWIVCLQYHGWLFLFF